MNSDSAKPKILVIDDSRTSVQIMKLVLESEYELAIAGSGEEGLSLLVSFEPDLVLLDIIMPDMDGYEVCRRIKAYSATRNIPVIFMTALDGSVDEEKGLLLGAIDYITKPFRESIFRVRIRNHIDLKKYRDEIARLSVQDGLTGISNRRRFDEYLEHEWLRAARNKGPISLVLSDIDFFKNFNDNYGHTSGDDCLCAVARALSSSTKRPADLVARYGGEEFACVLPETEGEGAVGIANRMRELVAGLGISHAHSDVAPHVTVSLGVATLTPDRGARASDLINLADECLYKAKRDGRNQIHNAGFF
jgi:diguanylate cyclase (GGDEF)-like protein